LTARRCRDRWLGLVFASAAGLVRIKTNATVFAITSFCLVEVTPR
jgi:hypothetical protein